MAPTQPFMEEYDRFWAVLLLLPNKTQSSILSPWFSASSKNYLSCNSLSSFFLKNIPPIAVLWLQLAYLFSPSESYYRSWLVVGVPAFSCQPQLALEICNFPQLLMETRVVKKWELIYFLLVLQWPFNCARRPPFFFLYYGTLGSGSWWQKISKRSFRFDFICSNSSRKKYRGLVSLLAISR